MRVCTPSQSQLRLHPENPKTNQFQIMNKTEYACHECGSTLVETFESRWLLCPCCSRVSRDKPPDFQPAGEWDYPDVDGVEMEFSSCMGSITEHAWES